MSLYIGIEGVALTHSAAVAADADGNVLANFRLSAQPLSLHIAKRNVFRTRLFKLISGVTARAGATLSDLKDARICVGVSGVSFPYDAEDDFPNEFRQLEIDIDLRSVTCTGDAEIMFAAAAQTMTGSMLVSAMGSTALVVRTGSFYRYGGWGPSIGDEGSGYWIGVQALRALGRQHDQGRPLSTLWHSVDAWLRRTGTDEFPDQTAASLLWRKLRAKYDENGKSWDVRAALFEFSSTIYTGTWEWRPVVSSLTTPVLEAHAQNDATATAILDAAARHLVKQYLGACTRANVEPVLSPLVLGGGVFSRSRVLQSLLLARLRSVSQSPFQVMLARAPGQPPAMCGALLYALGESCTGNLSLPSSTIMERVVSTQQKFDRSESLISA
jgi:N-acetylglucosamine kinase-like BadF-type ATPase